MTEGAGAKAGGEADGARLLALARRELLDVLLPQLQGEARFRARLIANAMRLAAAELDGDPVARRDVLHRLRALVAAVLAGGTDVSAMSDLDVATALTTALRDGRLDARRDLYSLLCEVTTARRRPLG